MPTTEHPSSAFCFLLLKETQGVRAPHRLQRRGYFARAKRVRRASALKSVWSSDTLSFLQQKKTKSQQNASKKKRVFVWPQTPLSPSNSPRLELRTKFIFRSNCVFWCPEEKYYFVRWIWCSRGVIGMNPARSVQKQTRTEFFHHSKIWDLGEGIFQNMIPVWEKI